MIFVLTLHLKKKELMLCSIKGKLSLNLKATITEDLEGPQKTILNSGNSLFRINFNYMNVFQTATPNNVGLVRVTSSAIMFSSRKGSLDCDGGRAAQASFELSLGDKKVSKLTYLFCLGSVVNLASIMNRNNNSLEKNEPSHYAFILISHLLKLRSQI